MWVTDVLENMAVWGLRESCIHRIREEFEMCILTDFESFVICWEFFSEIRDGLSRECDLSWLFDLSPVVFRKSE